MDEVHYLISDASKKVDVEAHVLRYWEEELELDIPRNEMGHRYYTDLHIRLFKQVKNLKEKGYQLKAIKHALNQVLKKDGKAQGELSDEILERDMIAALKRLGVNVEKQLKVANLSSEFFKKNTSVATAKYQLQLGSAAEVSKVWQALDNLGISNVSILKVSHSKIDQYKEQVRVEAMQNAKQSAQTLAQAIGQSVGKCFYIYDSNNNVMPVFYDNMAVMRSAKAAGLAEDAAADEPLDFKTIKLQYNVQAKFVLE